MTLRKIRITLAAVTFICITWLFVDFTGTSQQIPWMTWLPKMQLLEAILAVNVVALIILAVITLVFGRIYCSIICPLGIMQDVFGWLGKKVKKNRYSFSKAMSWLRYTMLLIMVLAFIAGVGTVVQLLAPYSNYGLIATNILQPVYLAVNNLLASIAEYYDSYAFYHSEIWMRSLASLVIAFIMLIVLAILAWRNGRTYCNTVCPVGTVLSFLSRFSLFKIRFDADKCKNCSLCTRNCKSSCIDFKTHTVDYSRCVTCGDCVASCKHDALHYAPSLLLNAGNKSGATVNTGSDSPSADSSRRSFLLSSALLATAAMAQQKDKMMDGGLAEIQDKVAPERQTPLTPPGSLSAQNLSTRCTGCQLCISNCPNQVLRPSSDLMHLMQPVMSYERGYCRPECTSCSDVCPTGAIKPISVEVKASTQIGHAVWIKKNCIPITDGVSCGNCARHCPTGAIEMVLSDPDDEESPVIPAINEAICIGCGACENLCPARPFSAIYVEGHEVHKEV